jgi:hypothetical protein
MCMCVVRSNNGTGKKGNDIKYISLKEKYLFSILMPSARACRLLATLYAATLSSSYVHVEKSSYEYNTYYFLTT